MSTVTERRCDRCDKKVAHGIRIEVKYHHPRNLDLCDSCEGLFALWLGKHPLWRDHPLSSRATGQGYPTKEQWEAHYALRTLLQLVLVEMPAATNRDLACDGPVGDEESKVWEHIDRAAKKVMDGGQVRG